MEFPGEPFVGEDPEPRLFPPNLDNGPFFERLVPIIQTIGFHPNGTPNIWEYMENTFDEGTVRAYVYRIFLGLDSGGTNNAGGDMPAVDIFSQNGSWLGAESYWFKEKEAGNRTVMPTNLDPEGLAPYALFTARDDAVCIDSILISWPNTLDRMKMVFEASVVQVCDPNRDWYFSGRRFLRDPLDRQRTCFWIDNDHSFNHPYTGFQIHLPTFWPRDGIIPDHITRKFLCEAKWPFSFRTESNQIWVWFVPLSVEDSIGELVGQRHTADRPNDIIDPVRSEFKDSEELPPGFLQKSKKKKRSDSRSRSRREAAAAGPLPPDSSASTPPTNTRMPYSERLVINNHKAQPARELCESPSSKGPDYLDLGTGHFCRMADKTLWPVCDDGNGSNANRSTSTTDNCYDRDIHKLIINGVVKRDQIYNHVEDWTVPAKDRWRGVIDRRIDLPDVDLGVKERGRRHFDEQTGEDYNKVEENFGAKLKQKDEVEVEVQFEELAWNEPNKTNNTTEEKKKSKAVRERGRPEFTTGFVLLLLFLGFFLPTL